MLSPGTVLSSRYRIQSVLGQGGMGAVYLAVMEALGGKKVAVKEMELNGFSREELKQAVVQFNKEASFLANLDHPNLVPVTDFFIEDEKHYLVMSYVKGETLQQRMRTRGTPFSWDQVKVWAEPLVDVLHYLHTQNPPILFRDLKPSNIMLEESGRLRLIDFGIARTIQAGDRTSTFLRGTGTSGFSPIEQYGGGQSTDQRSDIYSLGATLYYLMTGKVPPDAVARISQGKPLSPPSQINPALPKLLDAFLAKSMALKQHDRYGSMMEFRDQMRAVVSPLDGEGPTEDFGDLPPFGETVKTAPSEPVNVASASPSKSIKVEMYPTSSPQNRPSNSSLLVGLGTLALVSFAVVAGMGRFGPDPAKAATNSLPGPSNTAVMRNVEDSDVPVPLSEVVGDEADKTSSQAAPQVERRPYQYIESLQDLADGPEPEQPVVTVKTPESNTSMSTELKPSIGATEYPTVSYPQSKPSEKEPENSETSTVEESVPAAEETQPQARQQPFRPPHPPGWRPPPGPEGLPPVHPPDRVEQTQEIPARRAEKPLERRGPGQSPPPRRDDETSNPINY